MVEHLLEVYRRIGLKFNADKSKVMVIDGKEGLESEIHVDWALLDQLSELKYFGCVLYE